MAYKEILQKGDPVLNKKSRAVTQFDKKLHGLLDDMKDTLIKAAGAGLAAPQIGILRRVVVVMNEEGELLELVNPEIVATSGEQDGIEGCLSLAGMYGFVTRPMEATVKAQDRYGEFFTVSGTGIVARCFCHELEHLDGHLFDEQVEVLYTEQQIDDMLEQKEKAKKR